MLANYQRIWDAEDKEQKLLLALLERDFCKDLKVNLRSFDVIGVDRAQDDKFEIYTHQDRLSPGA